jgi:hypothetical protein
MEALKNCSTLLAKLLVSLCVCLLFHFKSYSQSNPPMELLKQVVVAVDSAQHTLPAEKMYLHFDKTAYAVGDTMWFKAYLFNAADFAYTLKSGLLYLEISSDSNRLVKRMCLPVLGGLTWGDVALDETTFPAGNYIVRAYTNWMRNFGEDYIFSQRFVIAGSNKEEQVHTQLQLIKGPTMETARMQLQWQDGVHHPVSGDAWDIKVLQGKKVLYKHSATPSNGKLNLVFDVPEQKGVPLLLEAKEGKEGASLRIPLLLNRPALMDLQFMPEGGSWVVGQPARMAFKAIGEDGKGVSVQGKILNSEKKEVTAFKSQHLGMGAFDIVPEEGETYIAQIILPDNSKVTYPLPAARKSGTQLQVRDMPGKDSVIVLLTASEDIMAKGSAQSYLLMAATAGGIQYGAVVHFGNGSMQIKVPKEVFPTGVAHFTLLDMNKRPLNERIIFIDRQDHLKIKMTPDKTVYAPRDSIDMQISVTNAAGQPVQGSFSLAVTDDAQVDQKKSGNGNLITYLQLYADLKGYVEDPDYYFYSGDVHVQEALDNLLLTQGWVGYNWEQLFAPHAITYPAEPGLTVRGNVRNAFNKPVKHTGVMLFSSSPLLLKDTLTDDQGRFMFTNFPPLDTVGFVIQARNKRGRSFNVGVEVDEFKAPVFSTLPLPAALPWNVNSDPTLIEYVKNNNTIREEVEKMRFGGHALREVIVNAKKGVAGSRNLNDIGGSDIVLDEAAMRNAGKLTLEEVLLQQVKGFNWGYVQKKGQGYLIQNNEVKFVVDGMDMDFFFTPTAGDPNEHGNYLKSQLEYFTAEDIKGIEVMLNSSNTNSYKNRYLSMEERAALMRSGRDVVYLEITTRAGVGPMQKKTPGTYVYKPIPFVWPRTFYRPRYVAGEAQQPMKDLRATIHWIPDVVTDENGKARVSFYAADLPGTYTTIIEGSDMLGGIGYLQQQVEIRK